MEHGIKPSYHDVRAFPATLNEESHPEHRETRPSLLFTIFVSAAKPQLSRYIGALKLTENVQKGVSTDFQKEKTGDLFDLSCLSYLPIANFYHTR
jgi:hypothetical protein